MRKLTKTDIFKHILVIIFFIITSILFFSPVIKGQKILQGDIVQYTAMSKELNDYRAENNEETYWINNAFSGMPTYQLGAKYPHNYIKQLDLLIRFLPRPADYLFLYFIGFYFLMLSLKVEYRLAVLGALSFGLSTYLIIIIGAGHNAKAHAISYMPFVLGSIIYVVRKRYLLGFFLTTIFLGLQLTANHFQMTYYLMFIIMAFAMWFLYDSILKRDINHIYKTSFVLFSSLIFALTMNASNLMTTFEYSKESTRGNNSNLEILAKDDVQIKKSTGLDKDYILMWSYGKFESLNLFMPKIMGGGSREDLGVESAYYNFLKSNGYNSLEARNIVKESPVYWGDQPLVEAPAYLGIVVFFLFVFSIFAYKGKHKLWLLSAIIISLLLSYGKNFEILSNLFIDYFPMYNKFRAVSSIQVILELCVPVLAVLGLSSLFQQKIKKEQHLKSLYITLIIFIIIIALMYLISSNLTFSGKQDMLNEIIYGPEISNMLSEPLIKDRKEIYFNQLSETLIYVLITFLILFLYIKNKIKSNFALSILIILISFDLVTFSRNYVNDENFVNAEQVDYPFKMKGYFDIIQKDSTDFRIFDWDKGRESEYFFKSIDGYHGAKLARYDYVMEMYFQNIGFDIQEQFMGNNVTDLLNTKYIIIPDKSNRKSALVIQRPNASGNAWFVKENIFVDSDKKEILSLDTLKFKNVSVSQEIESKSYNNVFSKINLVERNSNYLKYEAETDDDGLIIFSEIFYPKGWISTIDGVESPHHRVNYLLRGMEISKGKHVIEFKFDPQIVKTSSLISLAGSSIFIFILILTCLRKIKKMNS